MKIVIRPALSDEGDYLSNLAIRSKGHWGYSSDFLEACRIHIKIDAAYLKEWPVYVLEKDEVIIGFYSLKTINGENRLDNLWIEPNFIKNGYGKSLFEHSVLIAKKLGWNYFRLAGEPGAISFYEKMGAKLIGEVQSRLKNDLYLPHMELKLNIGPSLGHKR